MSNTRTELECEKKIVRAQIKKIRECKDIIKQAKINNAECQKYIDIASGCLFFCPAYFIARDCLKDGQKLEVEYKDCIKEFDKLGFHKK